MARTEWHLFLLAVQFLTRLPTPQGVPFSDDLQIRSAKYYPLVGGLVGAVGGAVVLMAAQVFTMPVALLLSLAATLLATGALHEDGLADAADGLGGGITRERALEIMRDSRIGIYGAIALGLALALKVAVLAGLTPHDAAVLMIVGHGVSRMAAVQVIASTPYARAQGSKFPAPAVTGDGYRVALATALVWLTIGVLAFGPVAIASGAVLFGLGVWALRRVCLGKLGGYTGDTLGATIVLAELGMYLGVSAWL